MSRLPLIFPVLMVLAAVTCNADGPADNNSATVRRVPPPGISVPDEVRKELTEQLRVLDAAIRELSISADARTAELLPDVQIFHRAVRDALAYDEFFDDKELPLARQLLKQGLERAEQLKRGEAPWTKQTGLVVRGYVSRIDASVQPYGLIVPESYLPVGALRHRLDVWFHGRSEKLSEVNFLSQRQRDRGVFAPADAFVLHPYGRYCNAFKFAGEVDVFEALEAVQKHYRIDDDRIAVRGFSMGGAACWQFAVHDADRWVAAAPGAGFSETPLFLDYFQKEKLEPTPWEKTLWRWYDCPDYAVNLSQLPTIAYSGENDIQKQAADIMVEALRRHNIDLVHLIGPKTGHSYHPASRDEIERRMTSIVAKGRDRIPTDVHLATYTLKYNRMHWVTVESLQEHWQPAVIDAQLSPDGLVIRTKNIQAFRLSFPPGWAPFRIGVPVTVFVDGQKRTTKPPLSDKSWSHRFARSSPRGNEWVSPVGDVRNGLAKRHNLQGPIDDAFMDSFLFVRPTGKFANPAVESWVRAELEHAIVHWRQQFRGHARVKDDTAINDADVASANLVLWGDPASNAVLSRIADKLPIQWTAADVIVGDRRFDAANHAPLLIHPNPLNPERYVVLNSSFTFREYDYLNNARQVARLPDWAIVDLRTPPDTRYPGKIVAADFFDEKWSLKPVK